MFVVVLEHPYTNKTIMLKKLKIDKIFRAYNHQLKQVTININNQYQQWILLNLLKQKPKLKPNVKANANANANAKQSMSI